MWRNPWLPGLAGVTRAAISFPAPGSLCRAQSKGRYLPGRVTWRGLQGKLNEKPAARPLFFARGPGRLFTVKRSWLIPKETPTQKILLF